MESKKTINEREVAFYLARVNNMIGNYEKVTFYMKKIMKMKLEMSEEEKQLIALASKERVQSKRQQLRQLLVLLEEKFHNSSEEDDTDNCIIEELSHQRLELEKEIIAICRDFISAVDEYLLPNSTTSEDKAFFWKLKADYLRYMAEISDQKEILENEEICERAFKAREAYEVAEGFVEKLTKTNSLRLGFFLNYTVFLRNILGDQEKAIEIGNQVFSDAIESLDELEKEEYEDACTVLELIRGNIKVWESEDFDDENEL